MSQGPLCPNLSQKVQKEVSQMANRNLPFNSIKKKKGEHYKAANYRPVSLTSICSKLMQHVIASQLMGHLNTNSILYDLQHGFQDKSSCETWLLALVHGLAHGVNANKQTDMAILYFSKALTKLVTSISYINFSGMELTPSHMLG